MASLPHAMTKEQVAISGASRKRKSMSPAHDAPKSVGAAVAKAQLLQLLDTVERERKVIPITKRGRVVAHLVPPPEERPMSNFDRVFGSMKGTGRIVGDIVSPDWESWGPEWR